MTGIEKVANHLATYRHDGRLLFGISTGGTVAVNQDRLFLHYAPASAIGSNSPWAVLTVQSTELVTAVNKRASVSDRIRVTASTYNRADAAEFYTGVLRHLLNTPGRRALEGEGVTTETDTKTSQQGASPRLECNYTITVRV